MRFNFQQAEPINKVRAGLESLDLSKYMLEPKLDGWRVQAELSGTEIHLWTRTFHDAYGKVPEIEDELKNLLPRGDVTIDGEFVFVGHDGSLDFNMTARILGSQPDVARTKLREQVSTGRMVYFVFDVLYAGQADCTAMPLWERKVLLKSLLKPTILNGPIQLVPTIDLEEADQTGFDNLHAGFTQWTGEGSMLKFKKAPYEGKRSKSWLKLKQEPTEEVVVIGYKPGQGKYFGMVGAIEFGQMRYDQDSNSYNLVSRGFCSGMTDDMRQQLTTLFRLEQDGVPDRITGKVIEIKHNGLLGREGFRHPQFKRFRDDKLPEECTWT